MDSHISEDSSTTFHVLKGRRRGVTRTELDHNVFTNFFPFNSFPNTAEVIIETSLKTNHKLHTSLVTGIDGFNSFRQISSNRLFTEYMLAVSCTCLDLFSMELRWRTNPYSINIRISNNIHSISGEFRYTKVSSGFLSLGDSGVGNNNRFDIRSLVNSSKMDNTNTTTSDHAHFDLLINLGLVSCHSESRSRLGTSNIGECKTRGGRYCHQGNQKSCKLHLRIPLQKENLETQTKVNQK
mmetsp:Transcript_3357/g.4848  ORF Transcript_3357/g.4848 Transcript_3357/m.4848 type:complete len:239 (-) Transcript_3357:53-769(-)